LAVCLMARSGVRCSSRARQCVWCKDVAASVFTVAAATSLNEVSTDSFRNSNPTEWTLGNCMTRSSLLSTNEEVASPRRVRDP
jgi:hypothetical protein